MAAEPSAREQPRERKPRDDHHHRGAGRGGDREHRDARDFHARSVWPGDRLEAKSLEDGGALVASKEREKPFGLPTVLRPREDGRRVDDARSGWTGDHEREARAARRRPGPIRTRSPRRRCPSPPPSARRARLPLARFSASSRSHRPADWRYCFAYTPAGTASGSPSAIRRMPGWASPSASLTAGADDERTTASLLPRRSTRVPEAIAPAASISFICASSALTKRSTGAPLRICRARTFEPPKLKRTSPPPAAR